MKSFVIILQESKHSCRLGHDAISAANNVGIYPEIYPAVLGFNSSIKFTEYGITRFLTREIIDKPGHQGCFLSHFELWLKCIELNEPIIILEHDGIFIRPLPIDILDQFNDLLYLDTYDVYDDIPQYLQNVENSLSKPINVWHRPSRAHWHGTGEHIWGAYGYIIKPHAAEKLVSFAKTVGAAPTDIHIGRNIVDIKSTTVTVVKMHHAFTDNINDIRDLSSTNNLSQYYQGHNSIKLAEYLSPRKYAELLKPH